MKVSPNISIHCFLKIRPLTQSLRNSSWVCFRIRSISCTQNVACFSCHPYVCVLLTHQPAFVSPNYSAPLILDTIQMCSRPFLSFQLPLFSHWKLRAGNVSCVPSFKEETPYHTLTNPAVSELTQGKIYKIYSLSIWGRCHKSLELIDLI